MISKPFRASEPWTKTPTRICCPIGPSNRMGDDGQGFVDPLAVEGSARQTSPVAAWARGSIRLGLDRTTLRRSKNNGIIVFFTDS